MLAAQTQKEVVVNEAFCRLDTLVQLSAIAVAETPPAAPAEGQCWLVGPAPSGAWTGQAGRIAAYSGGDWLFHTAQDGMRCWLAATGQYLRYENGWTAPDAPAAPSGGVTVDAESRAAIGAILAALTAAGIFPR